LEPSVLIRQACNDYTIEHCLRTASVELVVSPKNPVAHRLIHIKSESPYGRKEASAVFASPFVLSIMVQIHGRIAKQLMKRLLSSCDQDPLAASLCGYIFEPYAMEMMQNGGRFECRKLVNGRSKERPQTFQLTIPPSTSPRIVVDRVKKVSPCSNYTFLEQRTTRR
jgi:hypothetical protein